MKVTGTVEQIFAQAVALDQSGGCKNTIYAMGKSIFILNYDHTLLLKFRLRDTEPGFEKPVCFKANDYDSNEFHEKNGKIVFVTTSGGFKRKKTCGTPDNSPADIKKLFREYRKENLGQKITISRDVLGLLDPNLSHVEFHGEPGKKLKIVQRNIYSGGIIEISQKGTGLFLDKVKNGFGPISVKTPDFFALFNFQKAVNIYFPEEKEDFFFVRGVDKNVRNFSGVVACCLYDEICNIKKSRNREE